MANVILDTRITELEDVIREHEIQLKSAWSIKEKERLSTLINRYLKTLNRYLD
jgi:hypothetical protein